MSSQVTLPRLGQGMETGTIVRWLKSEGENVEKGDPLYELDTEKVTQEVEAEASGVLLKILAGEGEEIEVGKAIAVIGQEGEGFRYILDGMNAERILVASEALGDGYWFVERASKYASDRVVFGRYMVLAGVVRFGIEFIRVNEPVAGPFTLAQLISAGVTIAGIALLTKRSA